MLKTFLIMTTVSGVIISGANATDEAFYRKYRRMPPATKDRIRRMVELWGDDEADEK